jgi:hypothetical protein
MSVIISVIEQMPIDSWHVRSEVADYEAFFEWNPQSHIIPQAGGYLPVDLNVQNVSMLEPHNVGSVLKAGSP